MTELNMPTEHLLTIGQVADQTNVAVSAIRYYESCGLIASAMRIGGKRRFEPTTIGRINFIRRAQQTGFSLDEIGSVLDDSNIDWRQLVDAKVAELIQRRLDIETMLGLLAEIRTCGCDAVDRCTRPETASVL